MRIRYTAWIGILDWKILALILATSTIYYHLLWKLVSATGKKIIDIQR